jgi:hypothetical protein
MSLQQVTKEFLGTIEGIARYYGVSRSTVVSWRRDGMPLGTDGRYGHPVHVTLADVDRWLAARGDRLARQGGRAWHTMRDVYAAARARVVERGEEIPGADEVIADPPIGARGDIVRHETRHAAEDIDWALEFKKNSALIKKLALDRERGLLLERDAVERAVLSWTLRLKRLLQDLPTRAAFSLAHVDAAQAKRILADAVSALLDDLGNVEFEEV